MTKETFVKGLAILKACVVKFETDEKKITIWYELMKELSDRVYLAAIKKICQATPNIYPGTNIVAMILKSAEEVKLAQQYLPFKTGNDPKWAESDFQEGRNKLKLLISRIVDKELNDNDRKGQNFKDKGRLVEEG